LTRWNIVIVDGGGVTDLGEDATLAVILKATRGMTNRTTEIVMTVDNLKAVCDDSALLSEALGDLRPVGGPSSEGAYSRLYRCFGVISGDETLCVQLAHQLLNRLRYTQDDTMVIVPAGHDDEGEQDAGARERRLKDKRLFQFKLPYHVPNATGGRARWKLRVNEVTAETSSGELGCSGLVVLGKKVGVAAEDGGLARIFVSIADLKAVCDEDKMLTKVLGRMRPLDADGTVWSWLSDEIDANGKEFVSGFLAGFLVYDEEEERFCYNEETAKKVGGGTSVDPKKASFGQAGRHINGEYYLVQATQEGPAAVVRAVKMSGESLPPIIIGLETAEPASVEKLEEIARNARF
jgi:hypothetical protein